MKRSHYSRFISAPAKRKADTRWDNGVLNPAFDDLVAGADALVARGVKFEICEITLKNRGLKKEQFIQEADFTPSGVVRLSKLQHQGYAYIKP